MRKTSLNEKLAKYFLREIVLQKARCRFEAGWFSTYYDTTGERECYFEIYPTLDPKKVIHTKCKGFTLYIFRYDYERIEDGEKKKICLGTFRITDRDFLGIKVSIGGFPSEVTVQTRDFKITAYNLEYGN